MDNIGRLLRGVARIPAGRQVAETGGMAGLSNEVQVQAPTFSWYAVCKGDERGRAGPLEAQPAATAAGKCNCPIAIRTPVLGLDTGAGSWGPGRREVVVETGLQSVAVTTKHGRGVP